MVNIGEAIPQWVAFQYEKLSIFYYWCSLLNHDEKDRPLWTDDNATVRTEDQQYDAWLRAPTINLQQSQVVTGNNTLKHKPPSGPPRPPHPSSTPTSANTSAANPTNPITHNTPIQPPAHTSTENPKHMPSHPDMDPPTFSEKATHSVSTNKEILADKNLFNGHFSNIDKALNTYPFPSQSTTPQKETPSLDHPVIISADQTHHVPPTPYVSDSHLGDNPIMHVQDSNHVPLHGPKKTIDPSQGTWKRVGPPKQTLDLQLHSPPVGPKRKPESQYHSHATSIDKKQKLDEDTCTLGKIMAENLGSAVAAWQHHQNQ